MGNQLVGFLRAKSQSALKPDIDWDARKDVWIRSVHHLYRLIGELLQESIQAGDVTLARSEMEVTEEFVGTYAIPALVLTVGRERVEFRPKGVTIFGASGRVDIRGERDTVVLVRDEPVETSDWTVILQRVPTLRTAPLDRDSLAIALKRVMLPE